MRFDIKSITKKFSQSDPRDFVLKKLPKNSIGAEVGVHLGTFADRILKIASLPTTGVSSKFRGK